MVNNITNFWKVSKGYLNNVKNIKGDALLNKVVKIKINNKELIPKWAGEECHLYINAYNKNKKKDCDVYFNDVCMLKISKKIYLNNFNSIVNDLLFERYLKVKRPLYTRFPFPYHYMPLTIRNFIFNTSLKLKNDQKYPKWPIDNSADLLRFLFINSLKELHKKEVPYVGFWPNKEFAFMVTHDIETASGYKNIEKFTEIEKRQGIKSSWNIIANRSKIDFVKLKKLRKDGNEIGSHGYNHDGKLPYLSEKVIRERLKFSLARLKEFKIAGFRSPQLQRNEKLLRILSDYFDYDSSVPDTEMCSPLAIRNGATTVFPFFIGKMVELPLTMPQDFFMKYIYRFDKNKAFEIWRNKVDHIREIGGLVSLNVHPDSYISGNEEYLNIYERLLKYISKFDDCWKALPKEAARWWIERGNCSINNNKIFGSKRAKICY